MTVEARCREAAKRLQGLEFVRIFSDDDADGIAAAGILSVALDRAGIPFHLTLDRLDASAYGDLTAHETLLLMDQGAGELGRLSGHPGTVMVLDHHQVSGAAPGVFHANPNLEGVDGTGACCTASLAMYTALHLDPTNADLAPIALAGIVGDRQHVPRLKGPNASLGQRLISSGSLEARRGLPFPPDKPLEAALTGSVDPFLRGLTGSASRVHGFLEDLGVDPETAVGALTDGEIKRVTSALVAHLVHQGVEAKLAEDVAGRRYTGTVCGHRVTADQLTAMFNACARQDVPSLGVAIAHGDERALHKAEDLVDAYQEDLLKGLLQLQRDPPEVREAIQVFDAVDDDLLGAHCGIGMAYLFDQTKPTLAIKVDGERIKVSGRGTSRLVAAGVNLAEALRIAADEHGGAGGGHPVAAGAALPKENREAFLDRMDELVGAQLHG